MTDLEIKATELVARAEKASHSERLAMQPQMDRIVTTLTMQGRPVPRRLRYINNQLKDEALDDLFDNMPV